MFEAVNIFSFDQFQGAMVTISFRNKHWLENNHCECDNPGSAKRCFNFISLPSIMSLFKIIPWFNYQCPDNTQSYDSFSLTCARLAQDNEDNRDDIIIVTSHSGHFSILKPSSNQTEDFENGPEPTEQHSCVLYETKMIEPILAVLCGNFIQ